MKKKLFISLEAALRNLANQTITEADLSCGVFLQTRTTEQALREDYTKSRSGKAVSSSIRHGPVSLSSRHSCAL
ncbi:hypothetical protein BH10CYA1_BH10CYA1_63440 [soil metagenome]